MITKTAYKSLLLGDCDDLGDKDLKLTCIQGNVWLKSGKANYVNYVGTRRQSNTCAQLKGIDGCDSMCEQFFIFWTEPTAETCPLVKAEWEYECQLRVQLIDEKNAEQWPEAEITQGKLDGLYPELEPVWAPVSFKPVVREANPWLFKTGVHDLNDEEVTRLTNAFNKSATKGTKCSLLMGWKDRKTELLGKGFRQSNEISEVEDWHTNFNGKLSTNHADRLKQIENNKTFFNQSEMDYQKALTKADKYLETSKATTMNEWA